MVMDNMMGMDSMTAGGPGINWILIGVVAISVVLGFVIGIFLGRRAMKKRDI